MLKIEEKAHLYFPELRVTFKLKESEIFINDRNKWQILTFEKLEPPNVSSKK